MIDRDRMGQFHSDGDAVLQRVQMRDGSYGAMAYWNKHVFFACSDDYLRDYTIENGNLMLRADSEIKFADPGDSLLFPQMVIRTALFGPLQQKHGTAPTDPQYFTRSMPTRSINPFTHRNRTASAIVPRSRRDS